MKQAQQLFLLLFGCVLLLGSIISVLAGLFFMILAPEMAPTLAESNIDFGRFLTGVGILAFLIFSFIMFRWRKNRRTTKI